MIKKREALAYAVIGTIQELKDALVDTPEGMEKEGFPGEKKADVEAALNEEVAELEEYIQHPEIENKTLQRMLNSFSKDIEL